jgi:WD40 repeat protein
MRYDRDGCAQLFFELVDHSSWVLSLAFHPSGLQLISGSKDASIRCLFSCVAFTSSRFSHSGSDCGLLVMAALLANALQSSPATHLQCTLLLLARRDVCLRAAARTGA